jgi:stage V sporulation protein G
MNITEVKIYPMKDSKVLALANITLDDFVVSGLKVLDGKNGLWVAMPNRKAQSGEYHDIAFPVTKEAREHIQTKVLKAYHDNTGTYVEVGKQNRKNNEKDWKDIDVEESDLPF